MPIPMPAIYEADYHCSNPLNLILDEEHTLTAANNASYHYIIPLFAPYYNDTLVVYHRAQGALSYTKLRYGVDYNVALPYVGYSLASKKNVSGAISFVNLQLEGTIKIEYHTVGGEYTLDLNGLTEIVANIVYNPRITTWDQVANAPQAFPAIAHVWTPEDMVGEGDILQVLSQIRDAILNPNNATIQSHLSDFNNPHKLSKFSINLDKVQNMGPATIAETIAGISANVLVTPVGLKAALTQLDSRQYVTTQEVLSRQAVSKIVTFDMLLEFMRVYGNMTNIDPIELTANKPTILYPVTLGIYTGDQPLRCTSYTNTTSGATIKTQTISGNNTMIIPSGVNSLKISGRGGVGSTVVTGGSMSLNRRDVLPSQFEVDATISDITQDIIGDEGTVSVRVVAPTYSIDKVITLNLASSSSNQRVYSNSFVIKTNPNGTLEFGSVTLIYTGVAPTVTNTIGAEASVTVLGATHKFPGSTDSNTLPDARAVEIMLNVSGSTTVSYTCPSGTDITLTWYEPAASNTVVQNDCLWEIATTRTFTTASIIDGTHLGKGSGFTINSWKPTRDALVSNNTYFARSRWKFSDGTQSDWSDPTEFVYQAVSIFPAKDTIITYFCRDYSQWATVADGYGGSTERLVKTNSVECGYSVGGNTTTMTIGMSGETLIRVVKSELNLIQNGGAYPYQIVVPIKLGITNFIENLEDDRVRLYLKDDFYSSYLAYKNQVGSSNAANFRIPYILSKVGGDNNITIELVQGMSPTTMGVTGVSPDTYYVKISLNSLGAESIYSILANRLDVVVSPDVSKIFRDSTGADFINQNLVSPELRKVNANLSLRVLLQYNN